MSSSSPLLPFVLRPVSWEGGAIEDVVDIFDFTNAMDGERFGTARANFPDSEGISSHSSRRRRPFRF
jgi:hypothetical protein